MAENIHIVVPDAELSHHFLDVIAFRLVFSPFTEFLSFLLPLFNINIRVLLAIVQKGEDYLDCVTIIFISRNMNLQTNKISIPPARFGFRDEIPIEQ